jgi:uncharacterized protein YrrD
MLRRTNEIKGYTLGTRDGEIGRVKDFYFDDKSWKIRYLVADTGAWLPLRQVLISPYAVRGFRENDKIVDVDLTKEQVEKSPTIDQHKPVSRQFEEEYFRYYNYPYYWQGEGMWAPVPLPVGIYRQESASPEQNRSQDSHLRSTKEVTGYHIQALDGEIGHVEDFIINDEDCAIEYLVVDTVNWWPGKKVLVSPAWASTVDWHSSKVHLNLDRNTVKGAPEFDMSTPITREYEARLFAYYNQKPYWSEREAA